MDDDDEHGRGRADPHERQRAVGEARSQRLTRIARRQAVASVTLPRGVLAAFFEVDSDWSVSGTLDASAAQAMRASLRASGAALLLPRTSNRDRLGVRSEYDGTGDLARLLCCYQEASDGLLAAAASGQPAPAVREKDGKHVRRALLRHPLLLSHGPAGQPPRCCAACVQQRGPASQPYSRCACLRVPRVLASQLLEYRLNEELGPAAAAVERSVSTAYELLSGVARQILAAPGRLSPAQTLPQLDALMEAKKLKEYERGCSALTLFRYSAGSGAREHTDMGLLTLVYASEPGLELHTSAGWQALQCDGGLVILAGATLEAATGGSVRAALHRVVPQNTPRCSVVMRVRGAPDALLPGAPGGTVAGFEANFRATHGSVNAPRGPDLYVDLDAEEELEGASGSAPDVAIAAPQACSDDASLADCVLGIPALAALIVNVLADVDDRGVTLARAEMVCRALRAAAAPHWAEKCEQLHYCERLSSLPAALSPAGHATQWKRLYRSATQHLMQTVNIAIAGYDSSEVHYKVRLGTRFYKIFDAYCAKMSIRRDYVRFLFDGNRVYGQQTPYELQMEDGNTVDAIMEQCGD